MDNLLGDHLRKLSTPILLTGHTGFKGCWLTLLLEYLKIPVIGYSLPATTDSLYFRADRKSKISETFSDIRDSKKLTDFIEFNQPRVIVHMAAQPLVLNSYENPHETFEINTMGTVNLLNAAFEVCSVEIVIVVTTDKVYENYGYGKKFVETDPLKGKDPYSASKVAAESAVSAWQHISKLSDGPKVVSVRAGNVIGGGDFSSNRLLPDIIRSYVSGDLLDLRNPNSTRPWQHVLDPLIGYLKVIEYLLAGNYMENLNFGPSEKSMTVEEVVNFSSKILNTKLNTKKLDQYHEGAESKYLALDSRNANSILNWYPKFDQKTSIQKTLEWWVNVLKNKLTPIEASELDIVNIMSLENKRK